MKKGSSIFWGIIIIVLGVIFFGNNFKLWNIDIFFDGWWTLFIIIPSIYGLFKREFISSILGIIIGVLLLLASNDIIAWSMVGKSFLPLLLIIIGLSLVFKQKHNVSTNKDNNQEYVSVFSSNEPKITGKFDGASLVSVFGGVTVDLRKAKIKEDIVIKCVCVFGGIDIILPDGVKVKTTGVPIFGGAENKYNGDNGTEILIDYVCVFGGVDIK